VARRKPSYAAFRPPYVTYQKVVKLW
jgi:hypothetical protein